MSARLQFAILALIGSIGLSLILSSGWLSPVGANIALSVGTSVLATAIVSTVIRISLGDPTDALMTGLSEVHKQIQSSIAGSLHLLDHASRTGLRTVWTARQDASLDTWINKLRLARREIRLTAYAMSFLSDHPEFVDILRERLAAGCAVKVNLAMPAAECVRLREVEENENIQPRIFATVRRLQRLIGVAGFELRFHEAPLYCSVFSTDDDLLVTPHLYGLRGSGAPMFEIHRTQRGLFQKYSEHCERLWHHSKPYAEVFPNETVMIANNPPNFLERIVERRQSDN